LFTASSTSETAMSDDDKARIWAVEVHTPNVARGSLEEVFENLTVHEAIAKLEANLDKALVLRDPRGEAPSSDLKALDDFQKRTGKGLKHIFP
jgi:hypothetical protein